jgi:hypothetical protein
MADPAAPSAPSDTPQIKSSSSGSYYAQLASVQTRVQAEDTWKALQQKFPGDLSTKSFRVEEADLGERGIYYRIQAGPFEMSEARKLCDSIEAKKPGGCLVVKP